VAGVDNTILSSDLGLQGSQRPVDGFRSITQILLDLQMPRACDQEAHQRQRSRVPESSGDAVGRTERRLAEQAQRPRKAARRRQYQGRKSPWIGWIATATN
jgi:hypothetical protein